MCIEQIWRENYFTADGKAIYEDISDNVYKEKGKTIITALRVWSRKLGISGEKSQSSV